MIDILVEIAGWTGSLLILLAYALNLNGKLNAASMAYRWMNIIGSIGFIINSTYHGAYPSTALNVIWALLGLYAILKSYTAAQPVSKND